MEKEINPYAIKAEDLPLIILVNDRRSWIPGEWTHVMEMHYPGMVVSQDLCGFREKSIEEYMEPHITLEFWEYHKISEAKRNNWIRSIKDDLTPPAGILGKLFRFWKNRYDFLGIIGHILNVRWINNPWKKYCSERVARRMRQVLKLSVQLHRTPSEIRNICNKEERMKRVGHINLIREEDRDG